MPSLGARLKHARQRKNLTQLAASKMIGVTNVQLSRYESNTNKPDPELLARIAELYGVTTDYLLGRSRLYEGSSIPGQNSYNGNDENTSELSDNSSTIDIKPGIRWNRERSREVINMALERMKKEDAARVESDIVMIPVLGTIKAGYDLYAEQQVIDVQPVANSTVSDGAEYFYLVVKGDSMIGEGIREGMRVLVRRQEYVEDGKIGVILINGDEATLKRVITRENEVVLISANEHYPPRSLPIDEVRIQGQVKQVVWDV